VLVCHCNAVSDRSIRKAIREGASSLSDIGFASGAGTCCGGCVDVIDDILHTERVQTETQSAIPLPVIQTNA